MNYMNDYLANQTAELIEMTPSNSSKILDNKLSVDKEQLSSKLAHFNSWYAKIHETIYEHSVRISQKTYYVYAAKTRELILLMEKKKKRSVFIARIVRNT